MFKHFFQRLVVYEIMWKKMVQPHRSHTDDDIKRRRKDAICMPDNQGKNTDTRYKYLILTAYPRQHLLSERGPTSR
jgi:hypothetical protein